MCSGGDSLRLIDRVRRPSAWGAGTETDGTGERVRPATAADDDAVYRTGRSAVTGRSARRMTEVMLLRTADVMPASIQARPPGECLDGGRDRAPRTHTSRGPVTFSTASIFPARGAVQGPRHPLPPDTTAGGDHAGRPSWPFHPSPSRARAIGDRARSAAARHTVRPQLRYPQVRYPGRSTQLLTERAGTAGTGP